MSKTFQKISQGLNLIGQAADPADMVDGDIYYNNVTNKFRQKAGGVVSDMGGGGASIGGAIGGSPVTGSVLFVGSGGVLQQDNPNFFWDDTNNRLGVGLNSPANKLSVLEGGTASGAVLINQTNASNSNAAINITNAGNGNGIQVSTADSSGIAASTSSTSSFQGAVNGFAASGANAVYAVIPGGAPGPGAALYGRSLSPDARALKADMLSATATEDAAEINNSGLGIGLDINITNASNSSAAIDINHVGANSAGIHITQTGSTAGGILIDIGAGANYGISITTTDPGGSSQSLSISHESDGFAALIEQAGNGAALSISAQANGIGIDLTLSDAANSAPGFQIQNAGTGSSVSIQHNGTDGAGVLIYMNDADNEQAGVQINYASSAFALDIQHSGANGGGGINVNMFGGATGPGLYVSNGNSAAAAEFYAADENFAALVLQNSAGIGSVLEMRGSSSGYLRFQVPNDVSNVTLLWPDTAGGVGQVLTTDGGGNLSWETPSGGGTLQSIYDASSTGAININNTVGEIYFNGGNAGSLLVLDSTSAAANTTGLKLFGNVTSGSYHGMTMQFESTSSASYGFDMRTLTSAGGIRLRVPSGSNNLAFYDGSATVGFRIAGSSGSYNLTFPINAGVNGQALTTDGTGALNWALAQSWSTLVKTTTYTAADKDEIAADTSGGAFTITLPATPTTGMRVRFIDYASTWATNNLTVGRNGSNINGAAADFTANVNDAYIEFVYFDSTQGWKVFT